jgi:hypothetical protein
VYKLTNSGGSGTETTLYAFTGGADGFSPMGGVTFDRAGNLCGTMDTGVFELSPSGGGWTETVLQKSDSSRQRQALLMTILETGATNS